MSANQYIKLIFTKKYQICFSKKEKMVPAGIEPATLAFLCSISTMHYRLCYGAFSFIVFISSLYFIQFIFSFFILKFEKILEISKFRWKNVSVEIPLINIILFISEQVKMCYLKKRKIKPLINPTFLFSSNFEIF